MSKRVFGNVAKTICALTATGMIVCFPAIAARVNKTISYSPQEIAGMGPVVPSGEAKWFLDYTNTYNQFGGTITYYDPGSGPKTFTIGGMGHGIQGFGTDEPVDIVGIEAVVTGSAYGDLDITPLDEGFMTFNYNTNVGAFGETLQPELVDTSKAVGIAWPSVGPAQILATVDENGPQYHNIMITQVKEDGVSAWSRHSDFMFEFDGKLCSLGGMSGCPIIQNGKLVGALSAKLADDSSIGMGVSAADMITAQKRVLNGTRPKMSLRKIVAGNKGLVNFLWLLSAAGLTVPPLGPLYKKYGKKLADKVIGPLEDEPDR